MRLLPRLIGNSIVSLLFLFFFAVVSYAQSAPGAVTGVKVTYPSCVDVDCNFSEAACSWNAAAGAATYTVNITEVDSGTLIKNESVASTVLNYVFPVTSGKTYKCDVNAVNSSGQSGAAGTHSLLCQTDLVSTSPTVPPTATPVVVIPTKPTLPPPGNETLLFSVGGILLMIFAVGFFLLF